LFSGIDPVSTLGVSPFTLAFIATVAVVLCGWYTTLQLAWMFDSPAWYDRAEIVGGAAGLASLYGWLPIARGYERMFIVDKPVLWGLRWTLIATVVAMVAALGAKIIAERNEIWTPVDGVLDRRRIDIYDD
jgi:hypothetical protein